MRGGRCVRRRARHEDRLQSDGGGLIERGERVEELGQVLGDDEF